MRAASPNSKVGVHLDWDGVEAVLSLELRGAVRKQKLHAGPDRIGKVLVRKCDKGPGLADDRGDLPVFIDQAEIQLVEPVDHGIYGGEIIAQIGEVELHYLIVVAVLRLQLGVRRPLLQVDPGSEEVVGKDLGDIDERLRGLHVLPEDRHELCDVPDGLGQILVQHGDVGVQLPAAVLHLHDVVFLHLGGDILQILLDELCVLHELRRADHSLERIAAGRGADASEAHQDQRGAGQKERNDEKYERGALLFVLFALCGFYVLHIGRSLFLPARRENGIRADIDR